MDESEIRFDDCGELEPLSSSYGGTESNSKSRRILRTVLINMSFIAMGLCGPIIGPTLLDLRDILHTSISSMSLVSIVRCVCAISGSFSAGFFLDKYPSHRYTLLFGYTIVMGLTTTMIPFSPSLYHFFGLIGINGFVIGSLDTGGNVLCLDTWQGEHDSGPFMHSIHFSFGLGAFLAPLIAENFLKDGNSIENYTTQPTEFRINSTSKQNQSTIEKSEAGIELLYPIIGAYAIVVSVGYLVFAVESYMNTMNYNKLNEIRNQESNTQPNSNIVITIILTFLLCYKGTAATYAMYLATFSVKSNLHLSRQMGARITAVFWGSFTFMRFAAIFLSVKVSPLGTLAFSFFMSIVGSSLLAMFGDVSTTALIILSLFMGLGTAPIFASCMLWMNQFMTVTNKIGGFMTVAGAIGADVFPLFLGQFIATMPMLLMYMQVVLIFMCMLLFILAASIGKRNEI